MSLSFPSPLPLQHETAMRGEMSKALTVRATGFPEFLCKILVLTKQLMQDDLCLWVLPIDFNNTGHETTIMLSGSIRKYGLWKKSNSSFRKVWGSVCTVSSLRAQACFPRSSPSSWNKQEFVGTARGASQRRGLSEYWEPGSSLSPAKATQTWCEGDTSTVCAACLSSHGTSAKGLLEPFISIREM